MIVVSDTSPISGLLALSQINLLSQLYDSVIIPTAVKDELLKFQSKKSEVQELLNSDWVQIRQIKDYQTYNILRNSLDEGESQAITLAKEINADLILIDESRGRSEAAKLGLNVIGILGVLIDAKAHSYIPEVKFLVDILIDEYGFWVKPELYSAVLIAVGEG